jgi:PTS system cellobiose-specific IIB component
MVTKMQNAAKEKGFDCTIAAYSLSEMDKYGPGADCILLGPQVRYQKDKVAAAFPDKPLMIIDMQLYGMMKGKEVLEAAIQLMEG